MTGSFLGTVRRCFQARGAVGPFLPPLRGKRPTGMGLGCICRKVDPGWFRGWCPQPCGLAGLWSGGLGRALNWRPCGPCPGSSHGVWTDGQPLQGGADSFRAERPVGWLCRPGVSRQQEQWAEA